MADEMTDDELETWGLMFVEEHETDENYPTEGLTDQQKEWLEEFFADL